MHLKTVTRVFLGTVLLAVPVVSVFSPAVAANPEIFISNSVSAPSSASSCSGQGLADSARRDSVDLLRAPWEAEAASWGLSDIARIDLISENPVPTNPRSYSFSSEGSGTPSGLTVNVSARDVDADLLPPYGGSTGSSYVGILADVVNSGGSTIDPVVNVSSSKTMQDCAPYPASSWDASAAATDPFWNMTSGSNNLLDGVLFEFSDPVFAFGAWFGDLESRPGSGGDALDPRVPENVKQHPNGTPAWVKLLSSSGAVIFEGPVSSSPGPSDPTNPLDPVCGGPAAASDGLGCGNSSTRWVGFVVPPEGPGVASMLVTVGDDDTCMQINADPSANINAASFYSNCDGTTEHLSWIGASAALPPTGPVPTGELTISKTIVPENVTPVPSFELVLVGPNNFTENVTITPSQDSTVTLPVGTYSVQELPSTPWSLSSISCNGVAVASVEIRFNSTNTCSLENTAPAVSTVSFSKVFSEGSTSEYFTFVIDSPVLSAPREILVSPATPVVLSDLPLGSFVLSEEVPSGFDQPSIVCSESNSNSFVVALDGANISCVVTNTLENTTPTYKTVSIFKNVPEGFESQSFSFEVMYTLDQDPFSLEVSASENTPATVQIPFDAVFVTIEETVPSGWQTSSSSCSIASDGNISCSVVNDRSPGTVQLVKLVDDVRFTSTAFEFVVSSSNGSSQTVQVSQEIPVSLSVPEGTISLEETLPQYWQQSRMVCNGQEVSQEQPIPVVAGVITVCAIENSYSPPPPTSTTTSSTSSTSSTSTPSSSSTSSTVAGGLPSSTSTTFKSGALGQYGSDSTSSLQTALLLFGLGLACLLIVRRRLEA